MNIGLRTILIMHVSGTYVRTYSWINVSGTYGTYSWINVNVNNRYS